MSGRFAFRITDNEQPTAVANSMQIYKSSDNAMIDFAKKAVAAVTQLSRKTHETSHHY